jgi:hypothetical protein
MYFNSNESGTFTAVLPFRGTYSVEVARLFIAQGTQGPEVPIGEVEFSDPERRIEIAIPETRVITRVRSSERPVEGAVVTAFLRRDGSGELESMELGGMTDVGGQATFEGLVPGVWTFAVHEKETDRSAEKALTVRQGDDASVDLDLQWVAAIKGTVHDFGGMPLPRAHVDCVYTGVAGIPVSAGADADYQGEFSIKVSKEGMSALCDVIGPAGGIDAFRAVSNQHVDVTMPAATATLRIADWYQQQHPDMYWLAAADGRVVSLSGIATRISRFGAPLVVPGLASGRWKVVRIESMPQWLALGSGMAGSLRSVAEISLDPGASQTINLYNSSAH